MAVSCWGLLPSSDPIIVHPRVIIVKQLALSECAGDHRPVATGRDMAKLAARVRPQQRQAASVHQVASSEACEVSSPHLYLSVDPLSCFGQPSRAIGSRRPGLWRPCSTSARRPMLVRGLIVRSTLEPGRGLLFARGGQRPAGSSLGQSWEVLTRNTNGWWHGGGGVDGAWPPQLAGAIGLGIVTSAFSWRFRPGQP